MFFLRWRIAPSPDGFFGDFCHNAIAFCCSFALGNNLLSLFADGSLSGPYFYHRRRNGGSGIITDNLYTIEGDLQASKKTVAQFFFDD